MKKNYFGSAIMLAVFCMLLFCGCKKSNSGNQGGNLSTLSGNWQTTVWGGANDTARVVISASGTGTLTYLNTGAAATNFSVNDVIFSTITSTGNGTYSCTGAYRYTVSGNSMLGSTSATITLQNNNQVMYVHYAADASTGITPPDYYWNRQ